MLAAAFPCSPPETTSAPDFPPPTLPRPVKRRIPSPRNRRVFCEVAARKRPHREVAKAFKLTQPRVAKIMEQVRDWISQVTESEELGLSPEAGLRYAERLLEMRLDAGIRDSMQQWRASTKTWVKRTERRNAKGELIWTAKIPILQYGKVAFLNLVRRFSLDRARLAGVDVTGKRAWQEVQKELKRREASESTPHAPREVLHAEREEYDPQQDFGASKSLSPFESAEGARESAQPGTPVSTPVSEAVCEAAAVSQVEVPVSAAESENCYRSDDLAGLASLLGSHLPGPAHRDLPTIIPPTHQPKAIPRFLDKKVKKRLRARRQQQARASALAGVG